jgi:hypothetical protein
MNLQQQEEFYQVMTRLQVQKNSRAASSISEASKAATILAKDCPQMIVSDNPNRDKRGKSASTPDRISKETIQTSEGPAVFTKYYYDNSLPSTADQVYKCGLHDFETKNLTEFKRHVEDHGSKAASVSGIYKIKAIHDFINARKYK